MEECVDACLKAQRYRPSICRGGTGAAAVRGQPQAKQWQVRAVFLVGTEAVKRCMAV